MNKQHPARLSLFIHGYTISVEFDTSDVTMSEMFQAFKSLLVGATWNEKQIEDYIIEQGDILSYENKNDD